MSHDSVSQMQMSIERTIADLRIGMHPALRWLGPRKKLALMRLSRQSKLTHDPDQKLEPRHHELVFDAQRFLVATPGLTRCASRIAEQVAATGIEAWSLPREASEAIHQACPCHEERLPRFYREMGFSRG